MLGRSAVRAMAAIKELDATIGQMVADIKKAQADRTEAKTAVAEATSLREKEAAAFAKSSSDEDQPCSHGEDNRCHLKEYGWCVLADVQRKHSSSVVC